MEKINKPTTLGSMYFALRHRKIIVMIFLLSFLGFLDSTYLTITSLNHQIPPCTVTHGCETVLTSRFASVGPIPIAAFGIGYFIIMMVLSLLYIQNTKRKLVKLLFIISSLAFVAGLGLVYIQAMILKAFCQFCLLAELFLTLNFLLSGLFIVTHMRKAEDKSD